MQNVVVQRRGEKQELWFSMTDLDRSAEELCGLYGRRMQSEQLFQDHENRRNGSALRETRIRSPEKLSRALLIPVLGCIWVTYCSWASGFVPSSPRQHRVGAARVELTVAACLQSGSRCSIGCNCKSQQCSEPPAMPSWRSAKGGDR